MRILPQNNYVLCIQVEKSKAKSDKGILYEKQLVPIYEIVDMKYSYEFLDDFRLSIGDKVICNSTGTKVILEQTEYYLFNIENMIGKIA